MPQDNILRTENLYIRFDDKDKSVYMKDLKDVYNETSAYNTKKRGYKKFKEVLASAVKMGDRSTFYQWVRVADEKFNLRMHTYCAMD